MNVPEINNVKEILNELQEKSLLSWELPYENLLTRLSAAIFFIEVGNEDNLEIIKKRLSEIPNFRFMVNEPQKLSKMKYRIEFNKGDGSF